MIEKINQKINAFQKAEVQLRTLEQELANTADDYMIIKTKKYFCFIPISKIFRTFADQTSEKHELWSIK